MPNAFFRVQRISTGGTPAATAFTLALASSSGANGVATTVTVTPNATVSVSTIVTLALAGGGTLGTTTLTFAAGSSAAQTTTITRSTDGTSTITMTNDGGLANSGSPASYISPLPLPTWVPAAGEVATLSLANGKLANKLRDVVAPYYEAYNTAGLLDGYNGTAVNKYYGDYGAIVVEGGGHSISNDNSAFLLELNYSSVQYRRITNPTAFYGTGTDQATKDANAVNDIRAYNDYAQGEYTVDNQPGGTHSYGDQVVIGPSDGGATYGTFMRFVRESFGKTLNSQGVERCHKIDMSTIGGTYAWARRGSPRFNSGYNANVHGGPNWAVHVPAQNRVYVEAKNGNYAVRWFDLSTDAFVSGTGTVRTASAQSDGGKMLYIPSRNLIIMAENNTAGSNGVLRFNTMDVSSSDPSWSNTFQSPSTTINITTSWSEICWCEDTSRLIVGNTLGDTTGIYEIEIPTNLSDPWPATRYAFGVGQSIPLFTPGWGYNRWEYNSKVKSIVLATRASREATEQANGVDTIYVYRPRNT